MVKYLIFNTKSQALDRSEQIARSLGAGTREGDVTGYWFGVIEHPTSGEAAMEVSEEEIDKLNHGEELHLKDQDYMQAEGWFGSPDV